MILVRTHLGTTRTNERTRTSEGRRTGGKPRDRVGARARFPRALLRSFVRFRSFDFVRFRRVRPSAGFRPSVPSDRAKKSIRLRRGGALSGLFRGAVRDGWMDGCRDGRTARDASETSRDARANDEKKEDTARTGGGDRRPGRRPASRDGARCRATREQPTARVRVMGRVCVSCVSSRDS